MHRLIMDMPLIISASIRHAADHHGKTEVVAIANDGDIHRCDHATAHARTQQLANALPRLGAQPSSSLFSLAWNRRRGCHLVRSQAARHTSIAHGTASVSMPASARPRSGEQFAVASSTTSMRRDARKLPVASDSNWPGRAGESLRLVAGNLTLVAAPGRNLRTGREGRLVAGTCDSPKVPVS